MGCASVSSDVCRTGNARLRARAARGNQRRAHHQQKSAHGNRHANPRPRLEPRDPSPAEAVSEPGSAGFQRVTERPKLVCVDFCGSNSRRGQEHHTRAASGRGEQNKLAKSKGASLDSGRSAKRCVPCQAQHCACLCDFPALSEAVKNTGSRFLAGSLAAARHPGQALWTVSGSQVKELCVGAGLQQPSAIVTL